MSKAPLTEEQIAARMKSAQEYLVKRFPDLAFCLVVARPNMPGLNRVHAAFNMTSQDMRTMLRNFATHSELNERNQNLDA